MKKTLALILTIVPDTVNEVAKSTSADSGNEGLAQLDSTVTALTRNNGVITSCYIDGFQALIAKAMQ